MTWTQTALTRARAYGDGGKSFADLHPELIDRQHLAVMRADDIPMIFGAYDYLEAMSHWENYVWVAKAVTVIAKGFASLPYTITRNGEPVDSHPLLELLSHPNPKMSTADIRLQYMIDMMLGGEEGWEWVKGRNTGQPVEIWPRQPHTIKVVSDKAQKRYQVVDHYTIDDQLATDAEPYNLDPDEFTFFKFFNPRNPWRGISPFSAARQSIVIDQFVQAWNRFFFHNNTRPDYAVIAPEGTTRTDRAEIEQKLNSDYRGVDQSHKAIVLEEGVTDIKILNFPPKDLEMKGVREMSREEVGGIAGVPDEIMGWGRDTYENFSTAERVLWTLTLVPLIMHHDTMLTMFTRMTGMLGADESVVSDLSNVSALQEDITGKIESAGKLFEIGYTRDQINGRLGLGMDETTDGGDVSFVPVRLIPADTPRVGPVSGSATFGTEDTEDTEDAEKRIKTRAVEFGSVEHERLHSVFIRRLEANERLIARSTRELMEELRDAVIANLRREALNSILSTKSLDDAAANPFDLIEWNEVFTEGNKPSFTEVMRRAAVEAMGDLGLDVLIDLDRPEVANFIFQRTQRFAEQVNATTWSVLQKSLNEGVTDGEGLNKLITRVEEVMGDRIRSSAEAIARTETLGMTTGGTEEAWRQSGVVGGKTWISALTNRTRESHAAHHGVTVPLNADFVIDGCSGPGPGLTGCPGVDINCLCSLIAELLEEPTTQLALFGANGNGKVRV